MSVPYVERYEINGDTFGIEDYKDGRPSEEHFFADKQKERFKVWKNGCGLGDAKTIDAARKRIHQAACADALGAFATATKKANEAKGTLERLGTDPFNLGRFLK